MKPRARILKLNGTRLFERPEHPAPQTIPAAAKSTGSSSPRGCRKRGDHALKTTEACSRSILPRNGGYWSAGPNAQPQGVVR